MNKKGLIPIKDLRVSADLIEKHFNLQNLLSDEYHDSGEAYEALKKALIEHIKHLMAYRQDALLNILYRIDVSEQAFKKVLKEGKTEFIPEHLAELIIQRQLEKVKWRNWMKGN